MEKESSESSGFRRKPLRLGVFFMFGWLWNWLGWKKEDRVDLYYPSQRAIFHYWNGKKIIDADPLVLFKSMMSVGPELGIDLKVSNSESKDAGKAHDSAIVKIRNIFHITSLEEGGLTESEMIALLEKFLIYCESQKKM